MGARGQAQELKKELSEQAQAQAQQARDLMNQLSAQAATQALELKEARSEQMQVQEQHAQEQLAQAQALQEEIEIQGRTLSTFTIVNVLFLPLAFFTQASTTFTNMLILLLTGIPFCSISARPKAQEMAKLAPLSDYFGPLQPQLRPSSAGLRFGTF